MAQSSKTADVTADVVTEDGDPVVLDTRNKSFTPDMWAQAGEALKTSGGLADILFLKEGKLRMRLLPEASQGPQFLYHEVHRSWQGKPRTKYLIKGVCFNIAAKDENGNDIRTDAIKAVLAPKAVMKQILDLLGEGYDMFDPMKGIGFTITRSGSGLKSSYSVIPSPKPIPIPADLEDIATLPELAKAQEERDANRAENGSTGEGGRSSRDDEEGDW